MKKKGHTEDGENQAYLATLFAWQEKKEAEYPQVYKDSVREMIDRLGSWYYFRNPVPADGSEEIYAGSEGQTQKYMRLLVLLLSFPFRSSIIYSSCRDIIGPLSPVSSTANHRNRTESHQSQYRNPADDSEW